jgi:6-phosphogluconolactonase (cycloisomerase 2 family)
MNGVGLVRRAGAVAGLCVLATLLAPSAASATTGQLTYSDCLTSDTDVAGCTPTPGANNGSYNPLAVVHGVAVSSDGADVYAVSGLGSTVMQFRRDGASGALTFASCITSNNAVDGCLELPDAAFGASDASLDGLRDVVLSPDGTSLYVSGEGSDAVTTFARNPTSGALAFQSCIGSDSDVAACAHIAGSVADGTNTGLNGVRALAVSRDGTSLYATADAGDAVASFNRDPATGALTYTGCITSNSNVNGCSEIAGSAVNGTNTGLAAARSLALSSDGRSLYTAAYDSDAIARFERGPGGVLTYRDCLTASTAVAGCTALPGAGSTPDNVNLGTAASVALSGDDASVYVVGEYSSTVTWFARDEATGALTQRGCLTTNTQVPLCTQLPGAVAGGTDTVLGYPEAVTASADGNNIYTASYDGSVTRFARDPLTGAIGFSDCITSNTDVGGCAPIAGAAANASDTPFSALSSIALSPDGRNLYTGAEGGDAVSRFQRELPSNAFTLGKLKRNRRKGTAKLAVTVPGQGSVDLAGKALKAAHVDAVAPGGYRLTIKATRKKAKKLRRRGKLKAAAEVTFAPVGGTPSAQVKRVKLVRRRR